MTIQQADTTTANVARFRTDSVKAKPAAEAVPQPHEVLEKLPADATPEQQDSAIQAAIKVVNTHLSTRPDTLSLPGHDDWVSPYDISLPKYYKETYNGDNSFRIPMP